MSNASNNDINGNQDLPEWEGLISDDVLLGTGSGMPGDTDAGTVGGADDATAGAWAASSMGNEQPSQAGNGFEPAPDEVLSPAPSSDARSETRDNASGESSGSSAATGQNSDPVKQSPTMRKAPQQKKKRHIFSGLNYISQVIIGFVFISAFTVLIAIGVISIVWNQYFQMYTSENMNSLAETTSNRIATAFEQSGVFDDDTLAAAMQAATTSSEVGVRVLKNNGEMVFDSTDALPKDASGTFEPNNATQVAISNITVGESVVGSVRVWVYGSDTLMNHLDEQFRDNTYRALMLAAAVSIVIASLVGFAFARKLVSPINKVTRTAQALSEGDFSARTDMDGVGEVSRLGATLDEMARAIERDRELERRLTSDVAHELRTPLMAIQATVEAMIDGVYDRDDEHLMLVDSEVRRLSRLVDALLKLSRLENRTQPFKEEIVNLGELIEDVVISHEVFVVDSGLAIEYHAEPHVKIVGDSDKIKQAVANLISNAVRYTPEGGSILVDVHQEGKVAAIDVSDTGVGLTPEEEQMVFSRFWRADVGRKYESGGLGIGLAVVKEIVDRHKGKVLVKGEKGVGSTFTILLPAYDERQSLEQARRALRSFEKKNGGGVGIFNRPKPESDSDAKQDD